MNVSRGSGLFISFILLLALMSAGVAYYRNVVMKNFEYFTEEDQVPDQFELSNYESLFL